MLAELRQEPLFWMALFALGAVGLALMMAAAKSGQGGRDPTVPTRAPHEGNPVLPGGPAPMPPAVPTKFCQACGAQIDARAEICPRCGVRQPGTTGGGGKDRALAAALALLVGGLGIHKFYLGRVALGVLYLLFSWTGIPSLIGWIEGITYLLASDETWARQYGGPVQPANGVAIGCLWLVALLPLLAIISIIALVFLGGQVSSILSEVGNSI